MKNSISVLRDQIWQFIGVAVSLVALVVTFVFYFQSQQLKSLQVVILSNVSAVEINDSIKNKIKIIYADKEIDNISLLTAKIENNGNQSIRPEDYAKPITFTFPEKSEVIESSVIESFPENIDIKTSNLKNTVIFSSSLLNAGDQVVIRFVVINIPRNSKDYPKISARIADIHNITIISSIAIMKTTLDSIVQILSSRITIFFAWVSIAILILGAMTRRIQIGVVIIVAIGLMVIFTSPALISMISQ